MKRTLACAVILMFGVLLCSCGRYQYHAQTMSRDVKPESLSSMRAVGPVALKNGASAAPGVEQVVCQVGRIDVNTSVFDFTNSAIGTTKSAFQAMNIVVDDKANKSLEFSIPKVVCDKGWRFNTDVTLRVKTGSGLIREYQGNEGVSTGYQLTAGLELAVVQCIEQMLKDKEIAAYLEGSEK